MTFITGLMTRNFVKDYEPAPPAYQEVITGNVVRIEWKDLQPIEGAFSLEVLDAVYRAAQVGPVRLRINGGTEAPNWVKRANQSFPYVEDQKKLVYDCPRVWNNHYIGAWGVMMSYVYNEVGEFVTEICQSGGGFRYSESFIRGVWAKLDDGSLRNQDTFNEIGFNFDVDREALSRFNTIMSSIWFDKPLIQSIFPWQYMEDGRPKSSIDRTFDAIESWQPDVIGPHDIRYPLDPGRQVTYQRMVQTGIRAYGQTSAPNNIGEQYAAIEMGIDTYGMQSIELPYTFKSWDLAELQRLAAMFPEPTPIQTFPDVPPTHTFYADIEWMAAQRITRGQNDGTFRPSAYVTRGQMAAFLHRALGGSEDE